MNINYRWDGLIYTTDNIEVGWLEWKMQTCKAMKFNQEFICITLKQKMFLVQYINLKDK